MRLSPPFPALRLSSSAFILTLACSPGPSETSEDADASGAKSSSAGAGGTSIGTGGGGSGGQSGGALHSSGGRTGSGGGAAIGGTLGSGGAAEMGSGGAAEASGGLGSTEPSLGEKSESNLSNQGLTIVSYGGYLNGEAFQQEGIYSFGGFQYAAFWNQARHVVLGRRELPSGAWEKIEFSDYTNKADDAHNTISIGIAPGDGTVHLAFDHHGDDLHYRKSIVGLAARDSAVPFSAASFSSVSSALVGSSAVRLVTYPRFFSTPGGDKLLLSLRQGESGAGDEVLFEYDTSAGNWALLGKYIDGVSVDENAYLHGIAFTRDGSRLHAAWCSRKTPDATTNHDLYAIWSDDRGRTWMNDEGAVVATTGSNPVSAIATGARVWTIGENRGLINQEHMAVDPSGGVHVLLSHLPDAAASDSNFTRARMSTAYFHYYRPSEGEWTRHALGLPSVENFRGKLAFSASGNAYAVLPNLRIAAASPSDGYQSWTVLDASQPSRFFSDPLVDAGRLLTEGTLSVFSPVKNSGDLVVLDWPVQ